MKNSIIIAAVATTALGLITATGAETAQSGMDSANTTPSQQQPSTISKVENGTSRLARRSWRESKHLARAGVNDSKRIASESWNGSKTVASNGWTDTRHFASDSWMESKKVARTVVDSPVIAYQAARGERPLFPNRTASHSQGTREQIALTGHRKDMKSRSPSNEPPPI